MGVAIGRGRREPHLQRLTARTAAGLGGPTASELRIGYRPRADATPEGELAALATVYALVLERHGRVKTAARVGGEENVVWHSGNRPRSVRPVADTAGKMRAKISTGSRLRAVTRRARSRSGRGEERRGGGRTTAQGRSAVREQQGHPPARPQGLALNEALSQAELSGVGRETFYRLEGARRAARPRTARRPVAALGARPEDLMRERPLGR